MTQVCSGFLNINLQFHQNISVGIWYAHTVDLTNTHTHTHTFFLNPHCSLPCSVLRGSTLLNCIPQPIDYLNGFPCYTLGFCMPKPHQGHTQSLGRKMDAVCSPSSCPEPCVLPLHVRKLIEHCLCQLDSDWLLSNHPLILYDRLL